MLVRDDFNRAGPVVDAGWKATDLLVSVWDLYLNSLRVRGSNPPTGLIYNQPTDTVNQFSEAIVVDLEFPSHSGLAIQASVDDSGIWQWGYALVHDSPNTGWELRKYNPSDVSFPVSVLGRVERDIVGVGTVVRLANFGQKLIVFLNGIRSLVVVDSGPGFPGIGSVGFYDEKGPDGLEFLDVAQWGAWSGGDQTSTNLTASFSDSLALTTGQTAHVAASWRKIQVVGFTGQVSQ